jgi:C-lobe and N-lobe beta barrels of Tf-binding protein B
MRYFSLLALLVASTALGGCPTSDSVGSAAGLASSGPVCGVNAGNCAPPATPVTPGTPVTTPATGTNNGNTGNNAQVATGDATIALESGKLVSTTSNPSISNLTRIASVTTGTQTTPNQAKFEIATQTASNAGWPIAKTMNEYLPGTNASAGIGLGSNYKEYRVITGTSANIKANEVLQVWQWTNSFGTQYRDATSGVAAHQAWSFGGTKTAAASVPTSGSATYNGKFGAIAHASNWTNDSTRVYQTIDANSEFSVIGNAISVVDFANQSVHVELSPTVWNAEETLNGMNNRRDVDLTAPFTASTQANMLNGSNIIDNVQAFMYTKVFLDGTISKDPLSGNAITGAATFDQSGAQRFVTLADSNPMYAGLFGNSANEITGVFAVSGASPDPLGGYSPIYGDKLGFIDMSGVFHGQ